MLSVLVLDMGGRRVAVEVGDIATVRVAPTFEARSLGDCFALQCSSESTLVVFKELESEESKSYRVSAVEGPYDVEETYIMDLPEPLRRLTAGRFFWGIVKLHGKWVPLLRPSTLREG